MGEVKFKKGSEEWQMFMDYWVLCQIYWEPETIDSYWENLIKDTDGFYKKYNTDFSKSLALALVNESERKSKCGKSKT